jgi:hypothetical protein
VKLPPPEAYWGCVSTLILAAFPRLPNMPEAHQYNEHHLADDVMPALIEKLAQTKTEEASSS